jgi:hypothetical protein
MPLKGHPEIYENKTTEHTENSREHRDYDFCHCEALRSEAEQSEAIPMASWTSHGDCFACLAAWLAKTVWELFT